MKELINFIPRTVAECRNLLVTLRDNPEGVSIADRDGCIDVLNSEEIKTLASLVERQIGEKTPKAPVKEAPKAKAKSDPKPKEEK